MWRSTQREGDTRCTWGNDKRFESQHSPSTRIRQDGKMWSLPTRSSHASHEVARERIAAVFGWTEGTSLTSGLLSSWGPPEPQEGSQCVSSGLNYFVKFS